MARQKSSFERPLLVSALAVAALLQGCATGMRRHGAATGPVGPAASLAGIEGEWRSVRIAFAPDYHEERWTQLDLSIRRVSDEELRTRAELFGPYDVKVYGYRLGDPSPFLLADMEPGWIELDASGHAVMCLGPLGSHFRIGLRYEESLLRWDLEPAPFSAVFVRK
jgi:hypothetical protein